jgi:polar amino acid transport system substrate-binding protein
VVRNETDIQNMTSLLRGEIDIFVVNPDVGYYLIQQHFRPEERKKFACHPKPLRTSTNHVIFPKQNSKSERLLHRFNDGLRQLKASGKYDQYFTESRRGEYTNFKPEQE